MPDYLDQRNEDPKPFVRHAGADLISGKVACGTWIGHCPIVFRAPLA